MTWPPPNRQAKIDKNQQISSESGATGNTHIKEEVEDEGRTKEPNVDSPNYPDVQIQVEEVANNVNEFEGIDDEFQGFNRGTN